MLAETILESYRIRLIDLHETPAFYDLVERDREFFQPWIPFVPSIRSLEDARGKIARYKRLYGEGEAYFWSLSAGRRMIGLFLLMHLESSPGQAELGYMLASDYCGRGIATAACRRIMAFAFGELGLGRLYLSCDPRNGPSVSLALRLGFREEGRLRRNALIDGEARDTSIYGLLREECMSVAKLGAAEGVG